MPPLMMLRMMSMACSEPTFSVNECGCKISHRITVSMICQVNRSTVFFCYKKNPCWPHLQAVELSAHSVRPGSTAETVGNYHLSMPLSFICR